MSKSRLGLTILLLILTISEVSLGDAGDFRPNCVKRGGAVHSFSAFLTSQNLLVRFPELKITPSFGAVDVIDGEISLIDVLFLTARGWGWGYNTTGAPCPAGFDYVSGKGCIPMSMQIPQKPLLADRHFEIEVGPGLVLQRFRSMQARIEPLWEERKWTTPEEDPELAALLNTVVKIADELKQQCE